MLLFLISLCLDAHTCRVQNPLSHKPQSKHQLLAIQPTHCFVASLSCSSEDWSLQRQDLSSDNCTVWSKKETLAAPIIRDIGREHDSTPKHTQYRTPRRDHTYIGSTHRSTHDARPAYINLSGRMGRAAGPDMWFRIWRSR